MNWTTQSVSLIGEAERALAELSTVGRSFPAPHVLTGSFIRQEAVMSSRIEGTQATLEEIYQYEAGITVTQPRSDAKEVHNYVSALDHGIARLSTLPVSLRLIRELHQRLMEGVRGAIWTPGEFRRSQNWIGPAGSTLESAPYVPPPVEEMTEGLNQLERYIHESSDIPPIARVGLIHYQFEAIHPFLDGNGRVGRLLIALLLCQWELLPQPLLYLSNFFERHRSEYYVRLLAISQQGKWEDWLTFFLTGVRDQSREATIRIQKIQILREAYYKKFAGERKAAQLQQLADFLIGHPIVTTSQVQSALKLGDFKTAQRYIVKLQDSGILTEITGKSRYRLFRANEILEAIEKPLV